ncbi:cellulase family glycosylhydrolase [Mycolicibacterium psychrotolerans]|uniref:Endoglycoceramidase n=1 Tax=Mycolicibacterium psychrotolerans TaxID=216929 RepID=A0A7I7MCF8_9MYCO|nr:cellulase family glycosylhydrolase [Mycolicibacterium psychrotolerans]BBX69512.1 hypothetical protein MPSYJ_29730 [Mycolicibacterium psychrotolerans]
MTGASCIGRVGGLAVALGIGLAVSSGLAVASADTGTETGAESGQASGAGAGAQSNTASGPGERDTARPFARIANRTRHDARAAEGSEPARGPARRARVRIDDDPPSEGTEPPARRAPKRPEGAGPGAWLTAAAARRELATEQTPDSPTDTAPRPATAERTAQVIDANEPVDVTDVPTLVQAVVFTPIHTLVQAWINSDVGLVVDSYINRVFGSYVIGNGTAGTAERPDGGDAGWLLGDGGPGWNSTVAGVSGGKGGGAGAFGVGGRGGEGGAGADGGTGGTGGTVMGVGGAGGRGGQGSDALAGGAGGAGGAGRGFVLGVGGVGGDGGDGLRGGRGGTGGNGSAFLGSGGHGGSGGAGTGLAALGGAGGTAGLLGSHGVVGRSGGVVGAVTPPSRGTLPPLGTTGTWVTNGTGQVVLLHGLNEVYKIAPYTPAASGFGDDDAAFLAANGFNVVRLGVIWSAIEPEPGVYDSAYLDSIEQTVQTLAAHGIHTVIDMHQDNYSEAFQGEGAPDWATQDGGLPNPSNGFPGNYFTNPAEWHAWDMFWANASAPDGLGLSDHFALTWQQVAARFSGNTDVIGYEIINEPWPGSKWLRAALGNDFYGRQQLTPLYNQVIAAIRSVDPTTTVYVEPPNPGVSEIPMVLSLHVSLGPVDDPDTVLSYHGYCGGLTPICGFIANRMGAAAQHYARRHDMPALLTEFGATDDLTILAREMSGAQDRLLGWIEWAYSGVGDVTGSPDTEWLVLDPALPPVGDNVDTGKLALLAQPYPQVISGVPLSYAFTDGTMTLRYATQRADGAGDFEAGSQTVLAVPEIAFPAGYSVAVTGGHVVSAPGAPVLVVASDAGAKTVEVVVTAVTLSI